jgi:hypothetical protein
MTTLAQQVSRPEEFENTSSPLVGTRLAIHGDRPLGAGFQRLIAARVAAVLRGIDSRLERAVVRFEDLNGPKGGDDTACRIQIALSGQPPLIVEARAEGEAHAFRLAVPKLTAALNRRRDRRRSKPRASLRLVNDEQG